MRRREFVAFVGSAAAAWPLAARGQQRPAMPVVGILNGRTKDDNPHLLRAFRQGLEEGGYVEGKNVAIEGRWADGHYDRLPALAAELVRRGVTVIFAAGGRLSARAAKAATSTIPIVFEASDPLADGLIVSLAHPGGNLTGTSLLTGPLGPKRLELLRELVPGAELAMLVNPDGPTSTRDARELEVAARAMDQSIRRLEASRPVDLDRAFAALANQSATALVVVGDPFFVTELRRVVDLAARDRIPTIYFDRSFVAEGGLVSYGASLADGYHQCGIYVARILKGDEPEDLPVVQMSRIELVINAKTAAALRLTIPPPLLARADEVIE